MHRARAAKASAALISLTIFFRPLRFLAMPDWSRSALLALREFLGYETNLLQPLHPFFFIRNLTLVRCTTARQLLYKSCASV